MLTFQEKIAILSSFPELSRSDVSMGRVNFKFERSAYDKSNVGFHFHPNGNGYVFAGFSPGYETDDRGYVNVRDYGEDELRKLVAESIRSLTGDEDDGPVEEGFEETWLGQKGEKLTLKFEDDMWYVFSGMNLEAAFETREEALEYLREEGFTRS